MALHFDFDLNTIIFIKICFCQLHVFREIGTYLTVVLLVNYHQSAACDTGFFTYPSNQQGNRKVYMLNMLLFFFLLNYYHFLSLEVFC